MQKIYSAETLAMVEHIRALLRREGIETIVKNQYLSGGIGELPAFECWPELWLVDEAQAHRARELIEALLSQEAAGESWTCAACGETIEGQFGVCWSCGAGHPHPYPPAQG